MIILGNSAHLCPPPGVRFSEAISVKRKEIFVGLLRETLEFLVQKLPVRITQNVSQLTELPQSIPNKMQSPVSFRTY